MFLMAEPEHVRLPQERQLAIVRAMTPTQRLQGALEMNRPRRELLAVGFRRRHPESAETQVAFGKEMNLPRILGNQ